MNTYKLLLTSGGVKNLAIRKALEELVGKPLTESKVCYIPTAAFGESDNAWVVDAILEARNLGWQHFSIADLSATPKSTLSSILASADVVFVEGGNVYHLARAFQASKSAVDWDAIFSSKVYVGISAGSMIFSKYLNNETAKTFGEAKQMGEGPIESPFPWLDWYLKPHFQSAGLNPKRDQPWAQAIASKTDFKTYFIGDQMALRVTDGQVELVGTGEHYIS